MASSREYLNLTERQRRDVCAVLTLGCDRETAANYVNCSLADIRRQMATDTAFAADVRRAEAASEMTHMRNVQGASREVKNWRASVWWLERRAPDRFGRRTADAISPKRLQEFLEVLSSMVIDEVHAADDVERLLVRIEQAAGPYLESDAITDPTDMGSAAGTDDSSDEAGEDDELA
jgi:hypothetical protein